MFEDLGVVGRAADDAERQADVIAVGKDVQRDRTQVEDHVRQVLVFADLAELLDLPGQFKTADQAVDGGRLDSGQGMAGDSRQFSEVL